MVGYLRGLAASALVNCNVYEYCSRLHLFQIFLLKDLRSRFSWNQNGTNNQVCLFYCFFNICIIGYQCLYTCAKQVIQISQSRKTDIKDCNICAHSYCDLTCVCSYISTAKDYDVCLRCSRYSCQKNALASKSLLQVFCAFLDT